MKVVVKTGDRDTCVRIAHWWPGRDTMWNHFSPIPAFIRHAAYKRGSKYITMAYVGLPQGYLSTYAVCCSKDQPSREAGRFIALLRLARLLKCVGLKMERVA